MIIKRYQGRNTLWLIDVGVFAFLCMGIMTLPAVGQVRHVNSMKGLEHEIDLYIKPYVEIGGFSGSVLIARGSNVLIEKGYGMSNVELEVPNTPLSKFHIASLSKTLTAAAIMLLQEQRKLTTADPLSNFIADYPRGNEITIRHLLTHTSGIPDVNSLPGYDRESRLPQTTANLIALFKGQPLQFSPGERYSYSNSNYNLLAFIIERVSGQLYGEFLDEHIFNPLGMKNSGHDGSAGSIIPGRASGYVPAGDSGVENSPYIDWSVKTGNGSLYSTVGDLHTWMNALFYGNVLETRSKSEMFTLQANEAAGYGWFINDRLNRKVFRMSGRSPGFGAEMQHYVLDSLFVIVLGNNYAPTPSTIATDLAAIVFQEHFETPNIALKATVDTSTMNSCVGKYDGADNFFRPGTTFEVVRCGRRLIMIWSTGAEVQLLPQGDTRFFDRTFWAFVRFEIDENGRAQTLIWNHRGSDYVATRMQ